MGRGIKALKEIKKSQMSTDLLIRRLPFSKGGYKNSIGHKIRSEVSEYSYHGPSRGREGLCEQCMQSMLW